VKSDSADDVRLQIFCAALTGVLAGSPDKAEPSDLAVHLALRITDEAIDALLERGRTRMPRATLWPDFIADYARYADVFEAPREMHEAVAIQVLATVLNKAGVTIPHGPSAYTLDLWEILLSESGGGRSRFHCEVWGQSLVG
jgi:hypothetical protein